MGAGRNIAPDAAQTPGRRRRPHRPRTPGLRPLRPPASQGSAPLWPACPPGWLDEIDLGASFVYHNSRRLFSEEPATSTDTDLNATTDQHTSHRPGTRRDGLVVQPWGHWSWPLALSSPERAILELLDELPKHESFHQADMLMEGLTNASPRRLQELLEHCRSVKTKRLFFFFADRHRHAWLKRLDKQAIDLGKGDRLLVKGGRFNSTYHITVPEDLDALR